MREGNCCSGNGLKWQVLTKCLRPNKHALFRKHAITKSGFIYLNVERKWLLSKFRRSIRLRGTVRDVALLRASEMYMNYNNCQYWFNKSLNTLEWRTNTILLLWKDQKISKNINWLIYKPDIRIYGQLCLIICCLENQYRKERVWVDAEIRLEHKKALQNWWNWIE